MCIAYRALGPGSGATRPPTVYSYAQISDECPEVSQQTSRLSIKFERA